MPTIKVKNKTTGRWETLPTVRGEKGDNYIITEEDYNSISEIVVNNIQPTLDEITEVSENALNIAKGKATGYVFDTVEDLDLWLQNVENTSKLVLGDNLYVREIGVPDYWWDGKQKQQLETQKVDLTEYVTQKEFDEKLDDIETLLGGI